MNCGIVGSHGACLQILRLNENHWRFSLSKRLSKNELLPLKQKQISKLIIRAQSALLPRAFPWLAAHSDGGLSEGEQRGSNQRSPSHSFDHSPNSCFHRPLLLIHSWQSGAAENRRILVSEAAVAKAGHLVQMPLCRVRCLRQQGGKDGETCRR